jgi:hypothetical protein
LIAPLRKPAANSALGRASCSAAPAVTLVEIGVVDEVPRRAGLALGDDADELVAGHRLTGVVEPALLTDRGLLLGGEVLAARRTGAVGGKDTHLVGQRHQPMLNRVVEHRPEMLGADPGGGEQVWPSDIPDEQSVAGEHPVGDLVVAVLEDEHADRFRSVPGGVHDLQRHLPETDPLTVGEPPDLVLGRSLAAEADPGAGLAGQLEVPADEVGVEVGVDHADDAQSSRLGVVEVLLDVSAGVDHDGLPGGGITDQVGGLGQAVEVVLGEVHGEVLRGGDW